MKPEFTAYQDGPHARVACVQCHVGPGASWFVQVEARRARGRCWRWPSARYSRPIPSPVQNLRPARDTCEQCHWPEKFHGDKVRRIVEYADDEKNTESVTTLRVHVGGGSERLGIATGIHWHMNLANEIEYIATDDKRQVIPYVRVKDRTGTVREYVAEGVTPEQLAKGERRRDGLHGLPQPPEPSDRGDARAGGQRSAWRGGDIPRTLPFVRREAVKALKARIRPRTRRREAIAPRAAGVLSRRIRAESTWRAGRTSSRRCTATQQVYRRNVFPEMNVQFGTYPNNIGHMDFPGCFRCHDDNHKTKDGKTIGQDCETCHAIE